MNIKKILAIILIVCCLITPLIGCGTTISDPDEKGNSSKDELPQTNDDGLIVIPGNDGESLLPPDDFNESFRDELPGDIDNINPPKPPEKNESSNTPTTDPNKDTSANQIDINDTGINNGKFEGNTTQKDFNVTYVSGTKNAYTYDESTKTLTFTDLSADSVYAINGKLNGNIVIAAGENYKLDLELTDFSLRSSNTNPIFIKSGEEIKITAKKGTTNYVYDERAEVDTTQTDVYGGAIHALADLEICGKGKLFVQSSNNNGIQTKKDLQVKNLSLVVECTDNALKGNDSVTIENCATLLVAKAGDAIKTEETNLSSTSGKQRGTVSILGGTHNIYAANDGIEASFDAIIDNGSYLDESTNQTLTVATVVNIYTDEYAGYKGQASTSTPSENSAEKLYICYPSNTYKYSIKFTNNDATSTAWVNGVFDKSIPGSRGTTYYVYSFDMPEGYTKMQLFAYESSQTLQNETSYFLRTDVLTLKSGSNAYKYSNSKRTWSWTTYEGLEQSGGGPGGMGGPGGEGNSQKIEYSAKGIKAANSITINAGTVTVKAVDDALHADNTATLESGATPTGNITVNGGTIEITTKDDGIHAEGTVAVKGGNTTVLTAYEGVEGNTINISGGSVSVTTKDDGFNSCATSGTGITISGGNVYVYAGGDGIDSNSRASYSAIAFTGGNTVIISTSGGNSAIDSDGGYKYTAGKVLAIMPQGGMSSESKHCSNFSSIGKSQNVSFSTNSYATVKVNGTAILSVKMPKSMGAIAIYLGINTATISATTSSAGTADANGVYWAK